MLSSLTPYEWGYLYRDQTTTLRLTLSTAGVESWPSPPVLHVGDLALVSTIEADQAAVWQITAAQTAALSGDSVAFWIGLSSGVGETQILGGQLERVDHGVAGAVEGLVAHVVVGPAGPAFYPDPQHPGLYLMSAGPITPDPANAGLYLIGA